MRKTTTILLVLTILALVATYHNVAWLTANSYKFEPIEVVSVSEVTDFIQPISTDFPMLPELPITPVEEEVIEPVVEYDTTFRVTAYCACAKCCGKWASKRPLDEAGNPIVYGASGDVLITNVSCASPLDFGTKVDLKGYGTVVVQDRTADWVVDKHGQNIIDIYMDNHEEARQWGLQYIEGAIVN